MAKKQITLSQAIEGYFLAAHARRLSPNTLKQYNWAFTKLEDFLRDDPPIAAIHLADVRDFLNSLHTLSNKSVLGIHVSLSALWTWAVNERLVERNIVRDIPPPRPEKRDIIPFTKRDVQLMLNACDHVKPYTRPGKKKSKHKRPTALRDRAILMPFIDTGIRLSELCNLRMRDIDLENQRIVVMGKGNKERHVPFVARTGQVLWRYLAYRENLKPREPLFATSTGRPMDRTTVHKMIQRTGNRAGPGQLPPPPLPLPRSCHRPRPMVCRRRHRLSHPPSAAQHRRHASQRLSDSPRRQLRPRLDRQPHLQAAGAKVSCLGWQHGQSSPGKGWRRTRS